MLYLFILVNNLEVMSDFPRKRQALPDPLDLLSSVETPSFLKSALKKPKKAPKPKAEVISKEPTVNPSKYDSLEQYDYFATNGEAILDYWNNPQELQQPQLDPKKFIRKVDTRRKVVNQPLPDTN